LTLISITIFHINLQVQILTAHKHTQNSSSFRRWLTFSTTLILFDATSSVVKLTYNVAQIRYQP